MKLRPYIHCKNKLGHVVSVRRDCYIDFINDKKIRRRSCRKKKSKKYSAPPSTTSQAPVQTQDAYDGDIDESFRNYPSHESEVKGVQNALAALLKLHSTQGQQLVMDVYE